MVKQSRVELQTSAVGDNVAAPIPMVDRGRGNAKNILGVIVHRDAGKDKYKIVVKAGILKGQYCQN
jgi:hypothetical protein